MIQQTIGTFFEDKFAANPVKGAQLASMFPVIFRGGFLDLMSEPVIFNVRGNGNCVFNALQTHFRHTVGDAAVPDEIIKRDTLQVIHTIEDGAFAFYEYDPDSPEYSLIFRAFAVMDGPKSCNSLVIHVDPYKNIFQINYFHERHDVETAFFLVYCGHAMLLHFTSRKEVGLPGRDLRILIAREIVANQDEIERTCRMIMTGR